MGREFVDTGAVAVDVCVIGRAMQETCFGSKADRRWHALPPCRLQATRHTTGRATCPPGHSGRKAQVQAVNGVVWSGCMRACCCAWLTSSLLGSWQRCWRTGLQL
jgi:hypothetical protein